MDKTEVFAGVPESAGAARRFVAVVLDETGFPGDRDAAVLLTSELVANAVRHSRSGRSGGEVLVTVSVMPGTRVRVTVRDAGPADGLATIVPAARPAEDREGGRGLWLVSQMSDAFAVDGSGRCWFSLAWDGQPAAAAAADEGALFALGAGGAW